MSLKLKSGSAVLITILVASPACADRWNYGSRLSLNSDWNDNPSLANEDFNPESTFRFLAVYDGIWERRATDTRFNLRPRFTTDYYPDSKFSNLSATDYFLPGSFSYQRPLTIWNLGFNAAKQSVLSSEETISQGSPIGVLQGDDTLTQISLTPSLSWQITEKDELTAGLNYGMTDYALEFTNRSDTTNVGGNFSYSRRLSERHAVGFSGFISTSDSDRRARIPVSVDPPTDPPTLTILEGEVTTNTDSYYLTADYDYAFSETSALRISYGLQDSTTESTTEINLTGQTRSTGSLSFNSTTFNVAYQTELQRAKYSIEASRIVTLDITTGQPQDRYQLEFDGQYALTKRLLGGWRLIAWTQEAVALEALDENNLPTNFSSQLTFASAEFRLDWNLTRKWYINSRYEYRWRKTDQSINDFNQNLTAVSNQLTIGVTYLWKELPR